MKRFLKILPIFLFLSIALFVQQVQACGASPTARIVSTPNVSIIYSGDQILFSGTTSSANCGSINQYRWQVDGVTKSWSSSYTHTFTLAAGVVEQVFTVQLRVRNTYNKYGYKTIYITVRDNQSLYYITDHLGSVRVTVDEEGEAVTWDDYYPYGKRMAQRTQNVGDNNDDTKYTGYQYEDEGDLNLYHAGARLYDPEIGRFLSRDRFDAKYPSFTPYQYAANNPINFVDVNGDSIIVYNMKDAEAIVADVNRIFEAKYGVSDALTFSKTSRDGKEAFVITANEDSDFDWGTDAYTEELNTLMSVDFVDLEVRITELDDDYGGGKTEKRGLVLIDNDLTTPYGESGTVGYTAPKHTAGGVFLHETLYHSTPLGEIEYNYWGEATAGSYSVTGPNWMRYYYGIRRSFKSPKHGAGKRQVYKRN